MADAHIPAKRNKRKGKATKAAAAVTPEAVTRKALGGA